MNTRTNYSTERTRRDKHHLGENHGHVGHQLADDELGPLSGLGRASDDDGPLAVLVRLVVVLEVNACSCRLLYLQGIDQIVDF